MSLPSLPRRFAKFRAGSPRQTSGDAGPRSTGLIEFVDGAGETIDYPNLPREPREPRRQIGLGRASSLLPRCSVDLPS